MTCSGVSVSGARCAWISWLGWHPRIYVRSFCSLQCSSPAGAIQTSEPILSRPRFGAWNGPHASIATFLDVPKLVREHRWSRCFSSSSRLVSTRKAPTRSSVGAPAVKLIRRLECRVGCQQRINRNLNGRVPACPEYACVACHQCSLSCLRGSARSSSSTALGKLRDLRLERLQSELGHPPPACWARYHRSSVGRSTSSRSLTPPLDPSQHLELCKVHFASPRLTAKCQPARPLPGLVSVSARQSHKPP